MAVIGTLLALLLFFALFGIFITQYVPIWMGDYEEVFASGIQNSMAQLKSDIDLQSSLGGPPTLATPFLLSSGSVPLLTVPTTATMNYVPRAQGTYFNISMQYGPSGRSNFYLNQSLGIITVYLPDRYYPTETFEYEADGVIQSQSSTHQNMLYPPEVTINNTGNHTSATVALAQFYGNATQVVSSGTVELYDTYSNVQQYPSNGSTAHPGSPFRTTLIIGTAYPCAWSTFLAATMNATGLAAANYTLTPSTCVAENGNSVPVKLVLENVNYFDFVLETFTVNLQVGQE